MGMNTYNKHIITDAVMNSNINSPAMQLKDMFGCSIQAVIYDPMSSVSGVFKLQASSDPATLGPPPDSIITNWTDIDGSSYTINSGGTIMWNLSNQMYNWIRVPVQYNKIAQKIILMDLVDQVILF